MELFEILFNARSSCCKLWLALCKGEVASSVISFYWNHHAVAWHGGAFEEYFDVYPNHLLYQEMVRDAHEKGSIGLISTLPAILAALRRLKTSLAPSGFRVECLTKHLYRKKLHER